MKKKLYDVAIIGGGLAGCLAAIELANKGKSVCLIEAKETLLDGTSNVTPARMGLGFHYIHKETGIVYLRSTIEFVKKYKASVHPLMVGGHEEESHPLRRGRYFITKDSLFGKEEILDTYIELKKEYMRLCKEDSSNRVFGDPEYFFTILNPSEYEGDVSEEKVACGVETAEHLLNWPIFKKFVLSEIAGSKNIEVLTCEEVRKTGFDIDTNNHALFCYNKNMGILNIEVLAPFVVNSTWENVEEITKIAGFRPVEMKNKGAGKKSLESKDRTNRLKILVEVVLPESLKNAHSMFFCMGPHCMFSNLGDGRGMLTYAPVTNFIQSSEILVPRDIAFFLSLNGEENLSGSLLEMVTGYGHKIVLGVSQYIPEMRNAQLLSVRFGIVVTKGSVDIFDHNSDFHIKNDNGIMSDEYPIGWVNNTCMKLLYAYDNARSICGIEEEQKELRKLVAKKVAEIVPKGLLEENRLLESARTKVLSFVLYRYFTSAELDNKQSRFDHSKPLIQAAMQGKLLITSAGLEEKKLVLRKQGEQGIHPIVGILRAT